MGILCLDVQGEHVRQHQVERIEDIQDHIGADSC